MVRHILAHEQFLAKVLGWRVDVLGSCLDVRERNVDVEEMEEAGKVVLGVVGRNEDVLNDRTPPRPGTLQGMYLGSNRGWTAEQQELRRGTCCCSGRTDLVICERNILSGERRSLVAAAAIVISRFGPQSGRRRMKDSNEWRMSMGSPIGVLC